MLSVVMEISHKYCSYYSKARPLEQLQVLDFTNVFSSNQYKTGLAHYVVQEIGVALMHENMSEPLPRNVKITELPASMSRALPETTTPDMTGLNNDFTALYSARNIFANIYRTTKCI